MAASSQDSRRAWTWGVALSAVAAADFELGGGVSWVIGNKFA